MFYAQYFFERVIIAKLLDSKSIDDENQEVLTWRNTLLRKVKSYIDNNFNPSKVDKVNMIDQTKDNFTQPLSVKKF